MKFRHLVAALGCALVLAACGGGSSGPSRCEGDDAKAWLCSYMAEWYFWYATAPTPAPADAATLDDYFNALLFQGDATFPADRYSNYESTESFNRFFGDGETLGYGLSVAGLEVEGRPELPLRVRYIEPRSAAAAQGLQRGDEIVLINGVAASSYIASNDFALLSPTTAGEALNLRVRNGAGERDLTLFASVFALTPVPTSAIVTSPLGRRMGYVLVKDMINQVNAPLETVFAGFRAQGVDELVLDLRYNGGGLVSVGATVASYIGGARSNGQDYARLLYNDQRAAANNQTYRFSNPASALGLTRVYVLTGPRTCSASEQVINGLSPFVSVVQIGDTSCGKPVGFLPTPFEGNTYSVVNFESVNQLNQGRYFDGLAPTCSVADDLDQALGSAAEGLLAAALQHADTGACPLFMRRAQPLAARTGGRRLVEPGERQGMFAR
jgi:hypothetical protein